MSSGPLAGLRVLELAGIGPAPLACMILADLGADVIRVERRGAEPEPSDQTLRGRRIVTADLKNSAELNRVLALATDADVLIEGYRPGVTERLGLGPADCLERIPARVRPHDRVGADRQPRQFSRTRHQLHFDHRRPREHRTCRGPTGAAVEPGR